MKPLGSPRWLTTNRRFLIGTLLVTITTSLFTSCVAPRPIYRTTRAVNNQIDEGIDRRHDRRDDRQDYREDRRDDRRDRWD